MRNSARQKADAFEFLGLAQSLFCIPPFSNIVGQPT